MSQQKFASNVVEKCLTFGGPEERQLLVNEMLGSTDENEPLQVFVPPPFLKWLNTCQPILFNIHIYAWIIKNQGC